MKAYTRLVHYTKRVKDIYAANSPPIYQTATFAQSSTTERAPFDYTRSDNPTRSLAALQVAELEQGKHGFLFASGMAALTTMFGLLKQGDHVIVCADLYGGTHRLLSQRLPHYGIHTSWVDTTDLNQLKEAFKPETRLVLIESPSNPLQKITDIKSAAALAHQHHALLAVDNTALSPWLQQPLLLGADIVMHSATKHLSGHSNVTAGALVVNDDKLAEQIAFIQNAEGNALAPFESWLLSGNIKTLGLRIERQQATAQHIAEYLQQHPKIKEVYYAGLKSHPGYALNQTQAKGAGSLISFTTGSLALSQKIVEETKLFTIAVSFGSLTSFISLPYSMSHASIPAKEKTLPEDLVRLSIGIEDSEDLIQDLDSSFK